MNELQNVNQLTSEILFYKNQAAQNFLEIGKRLNQVKAMIPEGEWVNYLNDKVSFSRQTANKLMRCANEFSHDASTRHLPLGKMFELLALPAENREEFMQKNNVEELAQKRLREKIKKYKKELAEAHDVNDSLRSERNEFKRAADDIQKKLERERNTLLEYTESRIELKRENEKLAEENQDLKNDIANANYMYQSQGEYTAKLKQEIEDLKQELKQAPEGKETIVVQDNPKTLAKIKELEEKLEQEKLFMMYDAKLNHKREEILNGLENFFNALEFYVRENKKMAQNHITLIDNLMKNYNDKIQQVKERLHD